ncbi:hypothetical protein VNO78_23553 [Psophocarpus tetragonolobus]|uniref:Uncharacterized protein n=1 Tax=Psophocarpus tetragonolobus TaxID=3891 RepID=A0AAN9XE42_PSOTE
MPVNACASSSCYTQFLKIDTVSCAVKGLTQARLIAYQKRPPRAGTERLARRRVTMSNDETATLNGETTRR